MIYKLKILTNLPFLILVLIAFICLSQYNFLLFHTLAEIFSIVIAYAFFIITWNSKNYIQNRYILFIGIAYLFIATLDLFHTLTYKGMNIFTDYDFYANQIWIGARYLESITLILAFLFLRKRIKLNEFVIIYLYLIISVVLILSIFYWKIFPVCFIKGQGLTDFKIISEYIISAFLLLVIYLFYIHKNYFDKRVYRFLIAAMLFTILSELSFTLYTDNYGILNQVGHYFKILSYYFIYKAVIETGLSKPFQLMFREIKQNEEELKQLNAQKDNFFSIIAHDLKNPFNNLLGISSLLKNNIEKYPPQRRDQLITALHSTAKTGYTLLENLLEWSRIQTNRIQMQSKKFNLLHTIKDVVEITKNQAEQKKIYIENQINNSVYVFADENMIATVIRNLLSNAVKFTPENGKIIITAKQQNSNLKISVTDNGVGIKPENMNKLFRIDKNFTTSGTQNERGTGLGLILCKEFIEKNKGQIGVESKYKKGSTFWFTIPGAKT